MEALGEEKVGGPKCTKSLHQILKTDMLTLYTLYIFKWIMYINVNVNNVNVQNDIQIQISKQINSFRTTIIFKKAYTKSPITLLN